MKTLLKITLFLLVLLLLAAFAFQIIRTKIGDFRPALTPNLDGVSKRLETNGPLSLPPGFHIAIFAENLSKPRDLVFSPGGTLLVSLPSENRVVALLDRNGDHKAEEVKVLLSDLGNPHGLAFYDNRLFVASEKRVSRYKWNEKNFSVIPDRVLFSLPAGDRHTTRSLAFKDDGTLFVSVGSACDVCYESFEFLAAVVVSDANGSTPRRFARGLRNSVFIKVNPTTGELWGTEMGRDFLGDDLPPDEINLIRDGKHYGWPICYGDKIHDTKFDTRQYLLDPCLETEPPVYQIQAHSAPLGLTFINSPRFPADWQGDLLVSYHGSWNRSTPVGYKVVRLKLEGNQVVGEENFLTGFLTGARALGRPVDLEFAPNGDLFLSDDKAGVIYRIWKE